MDSYSIAESISIALYIMVSIVPFAYIRYYPFFEQLRFSKKVTISIFFILAFLETFIFININTFGHFLGVENSDVFRIWFYGIYFVYSCVAIKESFFKHLISYLVCAIFAMVIILPVYMLLDKMDFTLPYLADFILISATTFPFFMLAMVLNKKIIRPLIRQTTYKTAMLIALMLTMILFMSAFITYDLSVIKVISMKYCVIRCTAFIEAIVVLVLFKFIVEEESKKMELTKIKLSQEKMIAIQKQEFLLLRDKVEETKRINHDIRHFFSAMNALIVNEDYDKLRDYLEKEEKEIPSYNEVLFTSNVVLNSILSYYYQKARAGGIAIDIKARVKEELNVDDIRLWILFGNLLENAIEASHRMENGEKKILVNIETKDQMMFIAMDNKINEKSITINDGQFISSKTTPNSGLGLQSITLLADKLGGEANFKIEDGWFLASVYIEV